MQERLKIGIYGSHQVESEQTTQLAQELGRTLALSPVIIITGGCSGIPYLVAQAAKKGGAEVWGFTSEYDAEGQQQAYPSDDISLYDLLFYIPPSYDRHFFPELGPSTPFGRTTRLRYRNFLSTSHVDAGIIIAGGWGTMNEFTHLLYDGKPIGVFTGTGGLADELPEWYPRLPKKSESRVVFHSNATELIADLLTE